MAAKLFCGVLGFHWTAAGCWGHLGDGTADTSSILIILWKISGVT